MAGMVLSRQGKGNATYCFMGFFGGWGGLVLILLEFPFNKF